MCKAESLMKLKDKCIFFNLDNLLLNLLAYMYKTQMCSVVLYLFLGRCDQQSESNEKLY